MWSYPPAASAHSGIRHEPPGGLGQGPGPTGLPGLAPPQEAGPPLPGQQVGEVLVRPEGEFPVLVHQHDGESHSNTWGGLWQVISAHML